MRLLLYSIAFVADRNELIVCVVSSAFVRRIVSDHAVNFGDLRLNRSRDIRSQVVGGGMFYSFFATISDWK